MNISFFEWLKTREGYKLPPPPPGKKKKPVLPPPMKKPKAASSSSYDRSDIKGQERTFGSRSPFGN